MNNIIIMHTSHAPPILWIWNQLLNNQLNKHTAGPANEPANKPGSKPATEWATKALNYRYYNHNSALHFDPPTFVLLLQLPASQV